MENKQELQKKAQAIFQEMSEDEQLKLKKDFPELYKALWEQKEINLTAINSFLSNHTPQNLKVRNFEQFNQLSVSDQLNFKNQFPNDYHRIVKLSTSQSSKFEDIQTPDDFEKLSDEEKAEFRKEFPELYRKLWKNPKLNYLAKRERLSQIETYDELSQLSDEDLDFYKIEFAEKFRDLTANKN